MWDKLREVVAYFFSPSFQPGNAEFLVMKRVCALVTNGKAKVGRNLCKLRVT